MASTTTAISICSQREREMPPDVRRRDDDDSLAQLLMDEALKPSILPYRRFVEQVLELTGSALVDGGRAHALAVELEYAFAVFHDEVSPRDPRSFAEALYRVVTWAVETDAAGASLQTEIDALLAREAKCLGGSMADRGDNAE
jgi:hypothetical protein